MNYLMNIQLKTHKRSPNIIMMQKIIAYSNLAT